MARLQLTCEQVSIDDIEYGDHIFAYTRTGNGVVVQHHGIVVRGRQVYKVTSFTARQKRGYAGNGVIHMENLGSFAAGKQLVRVNYPPSEKLFTPEQVEYRAKRLEQHPEEFGFYDAFTNNCEHFCTFCKVGIRQSNQASLFGTLQVAVNSAIGMIRTPYY